MFMQGKKQKHILGGCYGERRHIRILRSLNAKAPEAFELSSSAGFLKKKKGNSEIKVWNSRQGQSRHWAE